VSRLPGRVAALRRAPRVPGAARSAVRAPMLATLVVLVAALLFPRFQGGNTTVMGLATEALTYGLVTMSLNLLMGYGGQVSVGQGGFLAVGAYTAAIVATHVGGLPFIVVLALAGLVTAAVGLLLGLPAGRLRGHYLAVATLGFGLAVPEIALNGGSLTGGYTGLIMPPQELGPVTLNNPVPLYYLALAVLVVSAAAIRGVLTSPTGRRFMAVRDSQDTAPAMGINVGRTKVVLFTLSAFFCGLAGYVFALNNSIVEYSSFDFSLSLFFFAAVIVGGLGSMWGSLIGAALLVVIQQEAVSLGGFSEAILGVAVVIALLLVPGGLAALPRRTRAAIAGPRILRRPAGQAGTGPGGLPGQPPAPSSPAGASREG
jgi:branched-chain amino acid transport system permease protein